MCTSPLYKVNFPPTMWKMKKNSEGKMIVDPRSKFKIVSRQEFEFLEQTNPEAILTSQEIPCRQCIECRIRRSQEWATRLYCESLDYEKGSCWFVTLTFAPDRVPPPIKTFNRVDYKEGVYSSLNKKDISSFMKNLRNHYGANIRFFATGEYGPTSDLHLPHYHLNIFGLKFDDLEVLYVKNGKIYYNSKKLEQIWNKGFVVISEFTSANAMYTAQYCVKKFTGDKNKEYYELCALKGFDPLQEEFIIMSRRPGIGKKYLEENLPHIMRFGHIYSQDGKIVPIPRYFRDYIANQSDEWKASFDLKTDIISSFSKYHTLLTTDSSDMDIRKERERFLEKRKYSKRNAF